MAIVPIQSHTQRKLTREGNKQGQGQGNPEPAPFDPVPTATPTPTNRGTTASGVPRNRQGSIQPVPSLQENVNAPLTSIPGFSGLPSPVQQGITQSGAARTLLPIMAGIDVVTGLATTPRIPTSTEQLSAEIGRVRALPLQDQIVGGLPIDLATGGMGGAGARAGLRVAGAGGRAIGNALRVTPALAGGELDRMVRIVPPNVMNTTRAAREALEQALSDPQAQGMAARIRQHTQRGDETLSSLTGQSVQPGDVPGQTPERIRRAQPVEGRAQGANLPHQAEFQPAPQPRPAEARPQTTHLRPTPHQQIQGQLGGLNQRPLTGSTAERLGQTMMSPGQRTVARLDEALKGVRAGTPAPPPTNMDPPPNTYFQASPDLDVPLTQVITRDSSISRWLRETPVIRQTIGRAASVIRPSIFQRGSEEGVLFLSKVAYEFDNLGRARAGALEFSNDIKKARFNFKNGVAQGVELSPSAPADSPALRTINDIIEHPERYTLTPEQQRAVERATRTLDELRAQEVAAGVDVGEVAGGYWRRMVTGKTGNESRIAQFNQFLARLVESGGGSPGFRGHLRERRFAFTEETMGAGFKVLTDPVLSFQARLEEGARAIANRKVLDAIGDLGRPLPESGAASLGNVALLGKQFSDEQYRAIANFFPDITRSGSQRGNAALRGVQGAFQIVRETMTTFDLGVSFIQGNALLYRNPTGWFKAWGQMLLSIVDDPAAYVARNKDIMDEGLSVGAISRPLNFILLPEGVQSLPLRIPGVGHAFRTANRMFEWFIITGQTELYKAAKGSMRLNVGDPTSIEELVSLGTAVRKVMGTEATELMGVRANQSALESMLMFAPRFFRANTGLIMQAFTPGRGGAEAKKALASMLIGSTAILTGLHWYLHGRPPNYTDPFQEDWMMVRIGNAHFSTMGPMYPYFRTLARVAFYMSPHDYLRNRDKESRPDLAQRELNRFMSSRASIPFRAAKTGLELWITGRSETFEGEVMRTDDPARAFALFMSEQTPLAASEVIEGIRHDSPERLLEVVGQVPRGVTPFAQRNLARQDAIRRLEEEGVFEREGLSLPPNAAYSDLVGTRGQLLVDRSPEVQGVEVPDRAPEDPFQYREDEINRLEQEVYVPKFRGLKGEQRRRAVQDYKRERFRINETVLNHPDVQEQLESFGDDPGRLDSVVQLLREEYYSAGPEILPSGEEDYTVMEAVRNNVLNQARYQAQLIGADPDSLVELITDRGGRHFSSPLVRGVVEMYEEDQDRHVKHYFQGTNDLVSENLSPQMKERWDEFIRSDSQKQSDMRRRTPMLRELEQRRSVVREQLRRRSPSLDVALLRWGYVIAPLTPAGRQYRFGNPAATAPPIQTPAQTPALSGAQ